MTESKTRSKPAAKQTDSKPATTAKKAATKKPAVTVKAVTVKKAAPEKDAAAVTKPARAKKAVAEPVATKAVKPAASVAKKTATSKSVTSKTAASNKKPAASKSVTSNKKPAASKVPEADKKTARKAVLAKAAVEPKAAAKGKKPAAVKKVTEVVDAPVAETKKRKAAVPAKPKRAKTSVETIAEVPAEVPVEVPVEKTSIQGASISFSSVQEPPQHLTLRVDVNRVVAFHYRLREIRPDGSASPWIEESFGRQPLLYLHGHGNVIAGLEQAMAGRKAGDAINITLPPELAYGLRTSNDLMRLPIKHLHGNVNPKALVPGSIVTMKTNQGLKNALVMKVGKFNVDVDTNHPYAGRTLHYQIEVLGVRPASAEEVAHRHVHGPGGHQH